AGVEARVWGGSRGCASSRRKSRRKRCGVMPSWRRNPDCRWRALIPSSWAISAIRLGDAGADQLAGAPDMGGSWIGRRCRRFAQHRRTEQADEPVKKDFVIGGPQQFVWWRLLVPDEIDRT